MDPRYNCMHELFQQSWDPAGQVGQQKVCNNRVQTTSKALAEKGAIGIGGVKKTVQALYGNLVNNLAFLSALWYIINYCEFLNYSTVF